MAVPERPRARRRLPEPRGHVAAPSREVGAGATGTYGSPGATPSREAGAVVLT
jgi:hypothetical protein